jgi:hypothetical protein
VLCHRTFSSDSRVVFYTVTRRMAPFTVICTVPALELAYSKCCSPLPVKDRHRPDLNRGLYTRKTSSDSSLPNVCIDNILPRVSSCYVTPRFITDHFPLSTLIHSTWPRLSAHFRISASLLQLQLCSSGKQRLAGLESILYTPPVTSPLHMFRIKPYLLLHMLN